MTFRFLSFGAGVQTTALLLMDTYDEVIFADTNGEHPETYAYMEKYVLPYTLDRGIKFTVLNSLVPKKDKQTKEVLFTTTSLEDFCLRLKTMPSRKNRWCTEKFKIVRIKEYIRSKGIELPATCVMGISTDEIERAHRQNHSRTWVWEYPLINRNMRRSDAERVITEHGWPVPRKSGCFYCPFQRKTGWLELFEKHRDLFNRAMEMEENSPLRGKYVLSGTGKPLRKLIPIFEREIRRRGGGIQTTLEVTSGGQKVIFELLPDLHDSDVCEKGFCMV